MKKIIIIILLTALLVTSVSAVNLSEFAPESKKYIKKVISLLQESVENIKSLTKLMRSIKNKTALIKHKEMIKNILVNQLVNIYLVKKNRQILYIFLSPVKKNKYIKITTPYIQEYTLQYKKYYKRLNDFENFPECCRILNKLTESINPIAQNRINKLKLNIVLEYKKQLERLYRENSDYFKEIITILNGVKNKNDMLKIKEKLIKLLPTYSLNGYTIFLIFYKRVKKDIPALKRNVLDKWKKKLINPFKSQLARLKIKWKKLEKIQGCKKILDEIKKNVDVYLAKHFRS